MFAPYSREQGALVVILTKSTSPPSFPPDLQGKVPADLYDRRVSNIHALLTKWHWNKLEKIWLLVSFIVTLVLPWPIVLLAERVVFDQSKGNIHEARLVGFGILVVVIALVWGPPLVWRHIGRRRIRQTIASWNTEDSQRNPSAPLVWSLRNSNTFGSRIELVVVVPGLPPPTVYDPAAYLPPYLLQGGGGAPAYAPYNVQQGPYAPPAGAPPAPSYAPSAEKPPTAHVDDAAAEKDNGVHR